MSSRRADVSRADNRDLRPPHKTLAPFNASPVHLFLPLLGGSDGTEAVAAAKQCRSAKPYRTQSALQRGRARKVSGFGKDPLDRWMSACFCGRSCACNRRPIHALANGPSRAQRWFAVEFNNEAWTSSKRRKNLPTNSIVSCILLTPRTCIGRRSAIPLIVSGLSISWPMPTRQRAAAHSPSNTPNRLGSSANSTAISKRPSIAPSLRHAGRRQRRRRAHSRCRILAGKGDGGEQESGRRRSLGHRPAAHDDYRH